MWNFFDATQDDTPYTNNAVEGWHRSLQNQFHAKNPSIWKFFEGIIREQALTELKYTQNEAGFEETPRKRYKDTKRRLVNVVSRFHNDFTNTDEYFRQYLTNVSYNL